MPSFERSDEELSALYVHQMQHLDANKLANSMPSSELHGRAAEEQVRAESLRRQAALLRDEIGDIEITLEDIEARKSIYVEAYNLAQANERGE